MSKTETLHIRLEPGLKASVENMLHDLGMSPSEAVNIFFHQVLLHEGLPFFVRKPRFDAVTLAAMKEADAIAAGEIPAKAYHTAAELIREAQEAVNAGN